MNSRSRARTLSALLAFWSVLLIAPPALAAPVTPTIKYRKKCDGPVSQVALGQISGLGISDKADCASMRADFDVTPALQGPNSGGTGIWDCLELHWLQVITSDDCPAKYKNVIPAFPAIDTPKGGWDYQKPKGDDDLPWYWNKGEEENTLVGGEHIVQSCKKYIITDCPGYCDNGGATSFTSYLIAVPKMTCATPGSDCLSLKSILLLEGFSWVSSPKGNSIGSGFLPGNADTMSVQAALGNVGFGNDGWKVAADGVFCCVPEPSAYLTFFVFSGGIILCVYRCRNQARRPAPKFVA